MSALSINNPEPSCGLHEVFTSMNIQYNKNTSGWGVFIRKEYIGLLLIFSMLQVIVYNMASSTNIHSSALTV